jgi:ABC-type enterobactin transport system permease subunit
VTQIKTATSKRLGGFTLIAVATFAMFLLSICLGSVNFSLGEVLQTLLGHGDANAVHRQIILDFRLPQVLTALALWGSPRHGRTANADGLSKSFG